MIFMWLNKKIKIQVSRKSSKPHLFINKSSSRSKGIHYRFMKCNLLKQMYTRHIVQNYLNYMKAI